MRFPDREAIRQEYPPGTIIVAGIDPEAMGYMTGEERREILVKAGLNPKEFDF